MRHAIRTLLGVLTSIALLGHAGANAATQLENDLKKFKKYAILSSEKGTAKFKGVCVCLDNDKGGFLTYSVGSGFGLRRHPGPFVVSTFTRVAEVRRVLDLTLEELEQMRQDPPSQDELAAARALLVGNFSLGLETSAAVMGALVNLEVYRLPQDSLDTYRGRIRATTSEDTARMASQLLHPDRAVIVLVGPAETLRPQLEQLGPVEVVEP